MKLLRLLLVPLALAVVGFVRIAARFGLLIRFGELWSPRIGHLAGNTECYLCERAAGLHPRSLDIWTHRGPIASDYLAKMLRRALLIDPTRFTILVALVNRMFEGWDKHVIGSQQIDRDIYNLMEKQPPHLRFTAAEHRRAAAILRQWGLPEDAKWVCLIVRDGAYLPGLAYHSFRDSDIDTYMGAAFALAKRGYYVFRMGAAVAKHFAIRHSHIFDYATNGMRSEFMDLYLGAHCTFCLSSGCGFDAIPVVFRRPVCYVNYVPVEYLQTYNKRSLAIWKHHERNGRRMTLAELWDSGAGQFMQAADYEVAGIKLIDNTSEEIVEAALEMADLVEGKHKGGSQEWFWRDFPRSTSPYNGRPLHGEIRMRIGARFLQQYEESIECSKVAVS